MLLHFTGKILEMYHPYVKMEKQKISGYFVKNRKLIMGRP